MGISPALNAKGGIYMAVFDSIAGSYDSWYESKLGTFVDKVETDLAFKLFKVKKGMKVLDIGCGTGNFSIKLAEMGCEVVAVDVSEDMLDIARKKVHDKGLAIELRFMDVYSLEFKDECFDAVFSMAAFEFIKEPEKAMGEIFRVVKKGGQVLIGTINRDSEWGELYLSKEFQQNTVFKHADFKTLDDMKKWRRENLFAAGQCLFITPNSTEDEINMEKERELSANGRGGYICAMWVK